MNRVRIQHIAVNDRLEHAIYIGDHVTLVESGVDRDDLYVVDNGRCTCPSFAGVPGRFAGRGYCRHTKVAEIAERNAEAELDASDLPLAQVE